jgi:hypothetical protein
VRKFHFTRNILISFAINNVHFCVQLYYHSCRDEAERKHSQLSGLALLEKTKENWKSMPEDSKVVWIEAAQAEEKKYRVRINVVGRLLWKTES